jgi:glycosyl transferase family 25
VFYALLWPNAAARKQPSAGLAQLVERFVYTEDVGGSSPSSRTIHFSVGSDAYLAQYLFDARVALSQSLNQETQLQAFVINLDRRPDRLELVEKTLTSVNIKFQRVSAIDGREVDVWKLTDKTKAWIYNGFRMPSLGMIACYFSHQKIWKEIVAQQLPQALIFEDDIVVANFEPDIMNLNLLSTGIELLRLEEVSVPYAQRVPSRAFYTPLLGREAVGVPTYGTAAYIITQEGAKKLLKAKKFWFNADHFDIWSGLYGVKTAIMRPNLFVQTGSVSDISDMKVHPGSLSQIFGDFRSKRRPTLKIVMKQLSAWSVNAVLDVLSFLPRMVMLYYLFFRRAKLQ